jgi:murein DD-endopeptidase MepM/ murein hydrolase activator NlpD
MLPIRRSDPGRIGARPRRARRRSLGRLLGGALAALAVALALPGLAAAPPAPDGAPPSLPLTGPVAASTAPRPSADVGDTVPASPGPTSLPPERLSGYRWPVLGGRVTTWFAPTEGGFFVIDGQRVHDGIDVATYCGDTVSAAHTGTVLYAGRRYEGYLGFVEPPDAFYDLAAKRQLSTAAFPIVVVIDDGNGYRSIYVHLSLALVAKGDQVEAGQRIGREGATGHATGCHLHYGLIRMDGTWLPVAPDLVERWRYPVSARERVDPLRVLSLFEDGAPREVPGLPPPEISPGYGPLAPLLESQRRRHEARQPTPD